MMRMMMSGRTYKPTIQNGKKLCKKCKTIKPVEQFNKGKCSGGLSAYCGRCHVEAMYESRKRNLIR